MKFLGGKPWTRRFRGKPRGFNIFASSAEAPQSGAKGDQKEVSPFQVKRASANR